MENPSLITAMPAIGMDERTTFLKKVQNAFNGKTLSELMEMNLDQTINKNLKSNDSKVRENNMLVLCKLLPELELRPEEELDCKEIKFNVVTDDASVTRLADTCAEHVAMNVNWNCRFRLIPSHIRSFLKILYLTSHQHLLNLLEKGKIWESSFLIPHCTHLLDYYIEALELVTLRFPNYATKHLLGFGTAFRIWQMREFSIKASIFYNIFDIGRIMREAMPLWPEVEKILNGIQDVNLGKDIDVLMEFERDLGNMGSIRYTQFAELRAVTVSRALKVITDNLFQRGDERNMLTLIMKLTGRTTRYRDHDLEVFKSHVGRTVASINSIQLNFSLAPCVIESKYLKTLLKDNAVLLQYLYVINHTWNRYLDVFDAQPLLEEKQFHCSGVVQCLEQILRDRHSVNLSFYVKLLRKCPIIAPLRHRRELLYRDINQLTDKVTWYEVHLSRNEVLQQLLESEDEITTDLLRQEWRIEFRNEIGKGQGLTKEFFSLVSEEFQRHELNIWFGDQVTKNRKSDGKEDTFTYSSGGLFPKETSGHPKIFFLLGQIMAKALLQKCLVDIPFSLEFFRAMVPSKYRNAYKRYFELPEIFPETSNFVKRLHSVKGQVHNIMSETEMTMSDKTARISDLQFDEGCSFEDLSINFTMPVFGTELIEGGENLILKPQLVDYYLGCIGSTLFYAKDSCSIRTIQEGFKSVYNLKNLEMFLPEELAVLFCGENGDEQWTVDYLERCCGFSDGYLPDSNQIQFLFEVMSSLTSEQRQMFLRFVCGTPRLPRGGLESLHPGLVIARFRVNEERRDLVLPSASTCFNTLFLPEYSTLEVTRSKLMKAIEEGCGMFQIV